MSEHEALAAIPAKWAHPPASMLGRLPKPYKKDNPKGNCPECGKYHGLPAMHLDYLGHAELTLALIEIDPEWTWEPGAVDPDTGGPMITTQGGRYVMWAKLTVLGKTMLGVGTCEVGKGEPEKELIGDFLRNAAMRFGVATGLWSKSDAADPAGSDATGGYERRPSKTQPVGSAAAPVAGGAFRTREEAQITAAVAELTETDRTEFEEAFATEFKSPLSDLHKSKHLLAWQWTRTTLGVP